MLRSFLIQLSKATWAQEMITRWGFAWRAASRFVAGPTIEDAIHVVRTLNKKGIYATLDQLGEHTTNVSEANRAADGILSVLDEIQKADVAANVSIKLTQIGMGTNEAACRANLLRILESARQHGNFIRIDMEDSPYTDQTLALYEEMLAQGFTSETVGLVVQSYLYRTEKDVRALLEKGTRLRLVKGAYQEPPEVAFPKKTDVDASYDTLTSILIDAARQRQPGSVAPAAQPQAGNDGRVPPIPAIATHDEKRIAFAEAYAEKVGLHLKGIEFQMLYGIRRDLQEKLAWKGYPVRVYVPFGTHWYPYFMRRLAERPANIWFLLSNFFKK